MSSAPPGSCSRSLSLARAAAKYVSRWRSSPRSSAPSARQRASERSGSGSRALSSTLRRGSAMTRATYWWTPAAHGDLRGSAPMPDGLIVVEHPVLADRLVVLRDRATPHGTFRRALEEAAAILAIEATRDLPTRDVTVETPLEPANGDRLLGEVAIVPVLRAGLGMVDGFLRLLPDARVGHLGMYRDEVDHAPIDYYERLPPGLGDAHVIVPDPMLATGGSAVHALRRLKEAGAQRLRLVCLVCAPEGVAAVEEAHPDVEIWTAALDRELDDNAFIRPGLGDAGDRVFGTAG